MPSSSSRLRWVVALGLALGVVALGGIVVACSGDSTVTGVPPITGVIVRAETLTAGRGCGTAPSQVFKTAAVVYGLDLDAAATDPSGFHQLVTANLYDCFADIAFEQLPQIDGSFSYRLELYVFDEQAYTAASASINGAVAALASAPSDQGAQAIAQLRSTLPTWTTTCRATQEDQIEVLALCDPLSFGLAGLSGVQVDGSAPAQVLVPTASFALPDGGAVVCANGGDAGPEGGALDGAASGGAAASAYGSVRVRVRTGSTTGPTVVQPCPAPFAVASVVPLTHYDVDVAPLANDGTPLGATVCSADALPGVATTAVCGPVR